MAEHPPGRSGSIRRRLLAVLVAVALLPALVVAGISIRTVRQLADVAATQSRAALAGEVSRQLASQVQEAARTVDVLFERVRSQARSLGSYTAFLYNHPEFFPTFLPGNTRLEQAAQGHWVNAPGSLVGVFAPRQDQVTQRFWKEANLLSHVDPVLVAVQESTPTALRAWFTSATGFLRVYPNPNPGHPGSPIGPDWDPRNHPAYLAVDPELTAGSPFWTEPYQDPAGSGWMVSVVLPVHTGAGDFAGVVGMDVPHSQVGVLLDTVGRGPGQYALLLDAKGRVLGAPAAGYTDLGLTPPGAATGSVDLAGSTVAGVRDLARMLAARQSGDLVEFSAAGGRRYAAAATLPGTGWQLVLVQPAAAMEAAAAAAQAELDTAERRLLLGWGSALVLLLLLVAFIASRASASLTRPIARLVLGTRRLAEDLSYRLPPLGPDEIGALAGEFNAMADKLESSRAAALAAARLAGEERERANRAREMAILEERNRLAREMHDTIAQGLAGIVLQLEAAEEAMAGNGQAAAAVHLERARLLARDSLQEARRSVWSLRPGPLEEAGLLGALRALAAGLASDGLGVTLELPDQAALPPAAEEALYRVAQEALANVRRHSGATAVEVHLRPAAGPESETVLTISDNGRGLDPSRRMAPGPDGGFGLWVMAERVQALGGRLEIESRPGEGTRVTARVPGGGAGVVADD